MIQTAFFGVTSMQTCKQIRNGGANILYGENEFVFDTTDGYLSNFDRCHPLGALDQAPYRIPGVPIGGSKRIKHQVAHAVNRLFEWGKYN